MNGLSGTLLVPTAIGSQHVVLIIAGSGPTDRDGNSGNKKNDSLRQLAECLCYNGIASVRYDKRGVGKSIDTALKEKDLTFDIYVKDAKAFIRAIGKLSVFDSISVLGHSEGSLVGMLAANDSAICSFISVAGTSQVAADLILQQLRSAPADIVNAVVEINAQLKDNKVVDDVPDELQFLYRPSVQPYLASWFKYNPAVEIARLTLPVLVIHGSKDLQVPSMESEVLASASHKAVHRVVEDMNHVLKEIPGSTTENLESYRKPDTPIHRGLVREIVAFVAGQQ